MQRGLLLVNYKEVSLQRVKRQTKVQWFRDNYGSLPIVYSEIWEDLQTATNPGRTTGHH
jgi:hypothetical protein